MKSIFILLIANIVLTSGNNVTNITNVTSITNVTNITNITNNVTGTNVTKNNTNVTNVDINVTQHNASQNITRDQNSTEPIPICSSNTTNETCKYCIGQYCHTFTVKERETFTELMFFAGAMTVFGFIVLILYCIFIRPVIYQNVADDITWSDSETDEDEYAETIQLINMT